MTYLVRALYRPDGDKDRFAIRARHIEHMITWLPRTVFGAAILDEESGRALGMIVVLSVDSQEEARAFLDAEPFFRAGLFGTVEIHQLRQMTPPYTTEFLMSELRNEQSHGDHAARP